MMKFALAGIAAAIVAATPATAQVVYDNGAPTTDDGNETTAWVQAESFSFGSTTTIGGAGVYLAGLGGIGAYDGDFQYYIFANDGGTPGAILTSGSVTPTITDTGSAWCCGGNAYLFQFGFANFTATAGTFYHLGIHASGAGDFARDDIYWVSTLANRTPAGFESFGGTFDNWSSTGNEHAFFLTGATVPEPASWALMIAGVAMVGGVARRRRTVQVSYG